MSNNNDIDFEDIKKRLQRLLCCVQTAFLNKQPLQIQMVIIFFCSYGIFLLLMTLLCIAVVVTSNTVMWTGSKITLQQQIDRNVERVLLG